MFRSVLMLRLVLLASGLAWGADAPRSALAELDWLTGLWESVEGERTITEVWMPPGGRSMLGASRTVVRGETVAHEYLVLREEPDGSLTLIAHPSGQAVTSFRRVGSDSQDVIFENLAHDFPQRVIYRRQGEHALVAVIEGVRRGTVRRVTFSYRRVRIDGALPLAPADSAPRSVP
jgi:hypothetical protein